MVKIGQQAPDFKLNDETGIARSLSEFKGKKIVIYFYPKDNTPGCTKEACGLRDAYQMYNSNNIVILGINYDSPESHKQFKEEHKLPFVLLSDSDREVARSYGAYQGIINMLFPQRMTFLIDEQGKVIHIFENVDISTHAQDILKAFGI